jgi:signal peptidase I
MSWATVQSRYLLLQPFMPSLFIFFTAMLIVFVLALLILRVFYSIATVEGQSMLPTLKPGDKLLVVKKFNAHKLLKGQIIVIEVPDNLYIRGPKNNRIRRLMVKRIMGLSGDIVSASVFIPSRNPREIDENCVSEVTRSWEVPSGCCFVQGDNLVVSSDSRNWGPISLNKIKGKVAYKFGRAP